MRVWPERLALAEPTLDPPMRSNPNRYRYLMHRAETENLIFAIFFLRGEQRRHALFQRPLF